MEQTINIEELVQDDHNLNKGTKEGQRLLERSFRELGAGRSILVDKDGRQQIAEGGYGGGHSEGARD